MNELALQFGDAGWIYFPTKCKTIELALRQICNAFDAASINVEDLIPTLAILRDANRNEIERKTDL